MAIKWNKKGVTIPFFQVGEPEYHDLIDVIEKVRAALKAQRG